MNCVICGAPLYADDLFNHDAAKANSPKRRIRCLNDHGILLDVMMPAKLERPWVKEKKEKPRRGRGRYKAGFIA